MQRRVMTGRLAAPAAGLVCLTVLGCDAPLPSETGGDTLAAVRVDSPDAADIVSFADFTTVLGRAALARNGNGVTLSAHLFDAERGEVFTAWAVVFDEPCQTTPCGDPVEPPAEPDVPANFIRITGGIAGGDGLRLSGRLHEGDASEGLIPGGPPLLDADAAEIHVIYLSHGDKIPGTIDEQLMTVDGGCDINACVDLAFSVHLP